MLPEHYKDLHDRFIEDWMHAEEVLKLVERIKNEAFLPSIKELRYAGRRVVDAHLQYKADPADVKKVEWHLIEAIENCRKSRHDAIDSAINFIHERLDKLISVAGLDTVQQAFPNYVKLKPKLAEMSEQIVMSRKKRERLDLTYEALRRSHLKEVVDLFEEMLISIPIVDAIRKRRKSEFWKSAILIGLIIGAVVGGAIVIADKRGVFDFATPAGKPKTH